jgi:hypothetical protein
MMNKTTNEILFDCQRNLLLSSRANPMTRTKVVNYILDYYKQNGREVNNNFSHDNWKGVACYLERYSKVDTKMVPVLGRHSWNPYLYSSFVIKETEEAVNVADFVILKDNRVFALNPKEI